MFDFDIFYKELFSHKDEEYRQFQSKLMPGISYDDIIGIRVPVLRQLAKKMHMFGNEDSFLACLPHKYYEENNLHGYLIEKIKDIDYCIESIDNFLPYINNWATCDTVTPAILSKYPDLLLSKIYGWVSSGKVYTVRFGIRMLMAFFLDDRFNPEYLSIIADIKSEEYYVNMMISWFFATALAKQWTDTYPYIAEKKLEKWIHNKTIQKAIESFRVSKEHKDLLRTLKY